METQALRDTLKNILKAKSDNNSTYRKGLLIYESILQSTFSIPNFQSQHANNDSNFALFVFGSVYKLLFKEDILKQNNFDSMLLLINNTIPHLNIAVLKQASILKGLQKRVFELIYSNIDKTPLTIRLGIAIIYHTFVNADNLAKDNEAKQILYSLFNSAVSSHRTNVLSKQTGKMLCHLVDNNSSVANILSSHVKISMQKWDSSELYLNNVREVIKQFSPELVNDIAHRVVHSLPNFSSDKEISQDEEYLTQTYFFLQKVVTKLNSDKLQNVCEKLINYTPSLSKNNNIIYCYLQALHSAFSSLYPVYEKKGNKYLSSIISVFQQFITKGGNVQKHSVGLLKSILQNCVKKSLWTVSEDPFDFENLGLEENNNHHFGKVICMLKEMLSTRYTNHKATADILGKFFDSLQYSAFPQVQQLIHKIVEFKDNFNDAPFKKVMHAIFRGMSIKSICDIYPITVQGDIGDAQFEEKTNLWLVSCVEKYGRQEGEEEDFNTFMNYLLPSLLQLVSILENSNLNPVRREAYKSLHEMFWRSLKVFCKKVNEHDDFEQLIKIIRVAIPLVSDSTLEHIAMALQNLCLSLYEKEYSCKWAGELIAELAKKLDLAKNNAKQLLKAIKYLSTITDRQGYLNKRFDKNIQSLLNDKEKKSQKYTKNLQILIAITNGIDFSDPTVVKENDSGKVWKYSRDQLVRLLIEELIKQNNNFQKKGYKYILQVIPLLGRNEIRQFIELIENNQNRIIPAAKHYRLSILKFLWDQACKGQVEESLMFIKNYLPEILIALRQTNQRTRKQANHIFDSFCSKIDQLGNMCEFIQIICAGLLSQSVQMKLATINGLSMICAKKYNLGLEFSLKILETVMLLFGERRSQLYKAILQYSRKFVFTLEKQNQITIVLPALIQELFKDEPSKLQHRSILKHFLLKLTKKHGREAIEKMIPSGDRKMLGNAIKTENRERRKKRKLKILRRQQIEQYKRKQQQETSSSEEESEAGDHAQREGDMDIQENEELQQLDNTKNLLLKYDLDKENFHFEEDKLNVQLQKRNLARGKGKQTDGVSFGENGVMIVKDQPYRERITREQLEKQGQQKDASTYINSKKKKKLNDIHMVKESGETFRSNRAGGDVKHKDKPEPYAFIQLNSKALNKRFKKRAQQVFDKIFEKHQGGLKGIKSKIASKMH